MIVDAHQHFWRFDSVRDSWITDRMAILRRDFLPGDLAPELARNRIDATVAVQVEQSETETQFLLELAASHPSIAGVVGWIDLRAPDLESRLEHYRQFRKLRGFRHIVQGEPDDFLLREDFRRGVAKLANFGFTYDILVYARQLPAAVEFVRRLPNQHMVIDHIAKPDHAASDQAGAIAQWEGHMRAIAAEPNVMCKLSGLITEADWRNWRPTQFRPYLEIVWDAFGPHRLMFGSDWPVCLLAGTYAQVKEVVEDFLSGRPAAEREAVFEGTAAAFYGLGE